MNTVNLIDERINHRNNTEFLTLKKKLFLLLYSQSFCVRVRDFLKYRLRKTLDFFLKALEVR